MTTLARPTRSPQYGSPVEVAAFLGVSTRTVRRLVDELAVPAYRVSRRVLVSFREADQFVQRVPTMATVAATPVSPHRSVDSSGRALPMTEDEVRARADAVARGLAAVAAIGDEYEQRETLEFLTTAVDENRLFESLPLWHFSPRARTTS